MIRVFTTRGFVCLQDLSNKKMFITKTHSYGSHHSALESIQILDRLFGMDHRAQWYHKGGGPF